MWPYKSEDWLVNEQFNRCCSKQPFPLPSPLSPTILPCLKPFGRCCNGGIGFICLLRQSSSCFNRQLGSRVFFTDHILIWHSPVDSSSEPTSLGGKQQLKVSKPKQANEAKGVFLLTCYFELIESFKAHCVLQTYHHWYGPRTKQTPLLNSQSESGAKKCLLKAHITHPKSAILSLSLQSWMDFRLFWGEDYFSL